MTDTHLRFSSPFDSRVAFASRTSGEPVSPLLPEEEALLTEKCSAKRRNDFTLGRAAARQALAELRFTERLPILSGARRQPLFPPGYLGSISHTHSVAVAAATPAAAADGIGVDIQCIEERFTPELIARFCHPAEEAWVLAGSHTVRGCMIFSAKESIFKALYAIVGVWFGFDAAILTWDDAGFFTGVVQVPGFEPRTVKVGVSKQDQFVLTGVFIEHG